MAAVTLKVKIQEDIILNNQDYSSKRTLEIENVNEIENSKYPYNIHTVFNGRSIASP